nr:serine-threonine/tyrosine-protein kinase catalytic domain-containing protein [Tanacetum cinerariifolium]
LQPSVDENGVDSTSSYTRLKDAQISIHPGRQSTHPATAFGLSSNREFAFEDSKSELQGGNGVMSANPSRPLHEITISTSDKPKLLCKETEKLRNVLAMEIPRVEEIPWSQDSQPLSSKELEKKKLQGIVPLSVSVVDVWEIDVKLLKFEYRICGGSNGDLYKGTFCTQDVAIKALKDEYLNENVQREFAQEVYIMRKVRHKNIVQFIGACTKPPNLCIVTEFMAGGSVYDFLHNQRGHFNVPTILKIGIHVSKGMNYLHENNIIHRDLKSANLLMDENGIVKVSDFGVARVQNKSGVMTAETGTYRWMAPEVIEHRPYNHKADVFSFGIVLWELLTRKLPYANLTPLQAAIGVVQKGLRPPIPKQAHPDIVGLLEQCWQQDPSLRPEFSEIITILLNLSNMILEEKRSIKRRNSLEGASRPDDV